MVGIWLSILSFFDIKNKMLPTWILILYGGSALGSQLWKRNLLQWSSVFALLLGATFFLISYFSKEKFAMTKTVREYAPIRMVKRDLDGNGFDIAKQMLLWVKADKKSDTRTLLAENVTYEMNLYNQDNPEWLESLSVSRLVDLILSQVMDGKSKAYDFFSNDKVALSTDVIRTNLGATVETYYVENEEKNTPDTVQVVGNIYPDEIRSVIFVEDWYIDDNMMIYKTVKRIAPVRHYHMVNELAEDEVVKKVPFVVDLNY